MIFSKETTPQSNFKCHTLFELNILLKFKDAFENGMQIKICAIVNVFFKKLKCQSQLFLNKPLDHICELRRKNGFLNDSVIDKKTDDPV